MKAKPSIAIATSLLAATLGGGCAEASPDVPSKQQIYDKPIISDSTPMSIPEGHKARLRAIHADAVKFGGKEITAKLVFVEGNDEIVCEETDTTQTMITARNAPAYCPQPDAVVMTGAWVWRMAQGTMLGDAETREWRAYEWVVGHELWHSVSLSGVEPGDALAREEAADRFAGCVMSELVQRGLRDVGSIVGTAQIIKEELSTVGMEVIGERRARAYIDGANDCAWLRAGN